METQLSESRREAPDALAKSLTDRVTQLHAELERLMADKTESSSRIAEVEAKLTRAQDELNDYKQRIEGVRMTLDHHKRQIDDDRDRLLRTLDQGKADLQQINEQGLTIKGDQAD
jgi:chromosome segregation ATPase